MVRSCSHCLMFTDSDNREERKRSEREKEDWRFSINLVGGMDRFNWSIHIFQELGLVKGGMR